MKKSKGLGIVGTMAADAALMASQHANNLKAVIKAFGSSKRTTINIL